ncbi:MAG: hypothetical protein ACREPI_03495 [Candidatus Dormibacterales bacterium]
MQLEGLALELSPDACPECGRECSVRVDVARGTVELDCAEHGLLLLDEVGQRGDISTLPLSARPGRTEERSGYLTPSRAGASTRTGTDGVGGRREDEERGLRPARHAPVRALNGRKAGVVAKAGPRGGRWWGARHLG